MVEIGIPIYKARETLPNLLDSIVVQTKKSIIVCLSIDGDTEDYSDIVKTYQARGLKIRVIRSETNGGPGTARQRVIDTTQCEFIMFADADDLLQPRAVEILHRSIAAGGYDILRSHFIRESNNGPDLLLKARDSTITWFHGKIYRTSYLKNLGTKIPSHLKVDEDAYFNLIAWYATEKRGYVDEITYIWRDNANSITRRLPAKEYFIKMHHYYVQSQCEALHFIFDHNIKLEDKVITFTLLNLYYYYMHAKYYRCDLARLENLFTQLRCNSRIIEWYQKYDNWLDVLQNLKAAEKYEDNNIVFFTEPFNMWVERLLLKGDLE